MARRELLALIMLGIVGPMDAVAACSGFDEAGGAAMGVSEPRLLTELNTFLSDRLGSMDIYVAERPP